MAAQRPNREADGFSVFNEQMIGLGQGRATAGKAYDEEAAEWRDTAHGFVEHVTANRIKNDIYATVAGQLFDLLAKAMGVVDDVISALLLTHGELFL